MENIPEKVSSAATWVPQFFYDLIGRLVPGAAVLVSLLLLFRDAPEVKNFVSVLFTDKEAPVSLVVLIGLGFSYLAGALLGAVGFLVQGKEWRARSPVLSIHRPPDVREPESLRAFMYDAVQLYDPQAGARLAKLAAEQHMCRVLMFGFSLVILVQGYLHRADFATVAFRAPVFLFLLVVLSSWQLHRHLQIRQARLLANHWYALDLAKKTRLSEVVPLTTRSTAEGAPEAGALGWRIFNAVKRIFNVVRRIFNAVKLWFQRWRVIRRAPREKRAVLQEFLAAHPEHLRAARKVAAGKGREKISEDIEKAIEEADGWLEERLRELSTHLQELKEQEADARSLLPLASTPGELCAQIEDLMERQQLADIELRRLQSRRAKTD